MGYFEMLEQSICNLIENPQLKAVLAAFGVVCSGVLNGNEMIISLIVFGYAIDFITGVAIAIKNKSFTSRKFFKGAIKIAVYAVLLIIASGIDQVFAVDGAWAVWALSMWIFTTDAISILENFERLGYEVPIFLVDYLKVRQDKIKKENDKK